MREHALPQDVVGYRFHIIGNMTLKQFAEVGAGCVVAFLFYSTNLTAYVKWPLVIIAGGTGALLAFVPFEERPLDQWVAAFFKALYRPTQFYWAKATKVPDAFLFEPKDKHATFVRELDLTPARRQRVKEYLRSVNTAGDASDVDRAEAEHLDSISTLLTEGLDQSALTRQTSLSQRVVVPVPRPLPPVPPAETVGAAQPVSTPPPAQTDVVNPHIIFGGEETAQPTAPIVEPSHTVVIPDQGLISIAPTAPSEDAQQTTVPADTAAFALTTPTQNQTTAQETVQINTSLPFPQPPTEPNKLVGMIVDQQNQAISDAVVEVLTADGQPARSVKTNVFGQFFVTTPLQNGTYTLRVEKNNILFVPQQLVVNNQVIPPIEVRGFNQTNV